MWDIINTTETLTFSGINGVLSRAPRRLCGNTSMTGPVSRSIGPLHYWDHLLHPGLFYPKKTLPQQGSPVDHSALLLCDFDALQHRHPGQQGIHLLCHNGFQVLVLLLQGSDLILLFLHRFDKDCG